MAHPTAQAISTDRVGIQKVRKSPSSTTPNVDDFRTPSVCPADVAVLHLLVAFPFPLMVDSGRE